MSRYDRAYDVASNHGKQVLAGSCLLVAGFYFIPFVLDPQKMNELMESLNVLLLYNVQRNNGRKDMYMGLTDPRSVHGGFIGTYFTRYDVFYVRNGLVDKTDRMILNLLDFPIVRSMFWVVRNMIWGRDIRREDFDAIWRENLHVMIALFDIFIFNSIKGVIYYKSLIFYAFAFGVVFFGHLSIPLELSKQIFRYSCGVI